MLELLQSQASCEERIPDLKIGRHRYHFTQLHPAGSRSIRLADSVLLDMQRMQADPDVVLLMEYGIYQT
jgi:hypothetical protein